MAPIYKRKTSFGGAPVEPEQAYQPPTAPAGDADVAAVRKKLIGTTAVLTPTAPTKKPKPLLSYRDVLGLSRRDVADIFNRVVSGKVKNRILADPSIVESQVAELGPRIKELQELVKTRSRHWQKIHRPDDMLSTAELQRLLRQEKNELEKLQEKKSKLQQRLRTWGQNKEDFVGETEEWVAMLFCEKHPNIILHEETPIYDWVPFTVTKRVRNAKGGFDAVEITQQCAGGIEENFDSRYNFANYSKLISLGPAALEVSTDGMTWEDWTRWENAAILVAITEGLVKPDTDVVTRHPALKRWTVPAYDLEDDDHDAERKLILKTGGAALGGGASIYSRGWRYGKRSSCWTQRALESFDATGHVRRSDHETYGVEYSEAGPSLRNPSDDVESYDPR